MFNLPLCPVSTPKSNYTIQHIAAELGNVLDELNIQKTFLIGTKKLLLLFDSEIMGFTTFL